MATTTTARPTRPLTVCAAAPGTLLRHEGPCDCLGARTNPPFYLQLPAPRAR